MVLVTGHRMKHEAMLRPPTLVAAHPPLPGVEYQGQSEHTERTLGR
jgi:hypothetical protein